MGWSSVVGASLTHTPLAAVLMGLAAGTFDVLLAMSAAYVVIRVGQVLAIALLIVFHWND